MRAQPVAFVAVGLAVMTQSAADGLRREIIDAGRVLYDRGLIAASQGNISVRLGDRLLVTASGASKGALTADLVRETDLDGRVADLGVSSEILMHVAIYRLRPDVHAIVHAHPPVATAFAVAGLDLDATVLAESVQLLGRVPLAPYATPSTPLLGEVVGRAMLDAQAALLANHGAVSVGSTIGQALARMETLEHLARVTLMARLLGEPRRLTADEVQHLLSRSSTPYR